MLSAKALIHMMLVCAFCRHVGFRPKSGQKFLEMHDLMMYILLKGNGKIPNRVLIVPDLGVEVVVIIWNDGEGPEMFRTCSIESKRLSLIRG